MALVKPETKIASGQLVEKERWRKTLNHNYPPQPGWYLTRGDIVVARIRQLRDSVGGGDSFYTYWTTLYEADNAPMYSSSVPQAFPTLEKAKEWAEQGFAKST